MKPAARPVQDAKRPAFESADSGDFERKDAFSFGAWIKLPRGGLFGSVIARMDDQHDYRGWDLWIENNRVATHLVNKWPENALKVVARGGDSPEHVDSRFRDVRRLVAGRGREVLHQRGTAGHGDRDESTEQHDPDHGSLQGGPATHRLSSRRRRHHGRANPPAGCSRPRRLRTWPAPAGPRLSWPGRPRIGRRQRSTRVLAWWLRTRDPSSKELQARLRGLEQEEAAIRSRGTVAHVMQEKTEKPMAYVLYRGEYDKRRDPVKPDTPDVLPPMPGDLPRNRLGFAQWLLRPEHPLTARVTVNRFWQEVFGAGLVRTTGDLGVSGELPSHPELLDWLAVEFRESGWDVKRFFKLLVTSATYRQAAVSTPEKTEKDPQNRLLSRGPRFRLDGEMIRDYALAVSGLLVDKVGGPSVRPYQPDGVWEAVAMPESNTRIYQRDKGENLYRRSLYTFWKRSAPPASLDIFNAPSREFCTVRRERTDTPLQALVTLNDPQFIEAARGLAQLTLAKAGQSPDSRIDFMARRVLARPLRPEELQVVKTSVERLCAFYQSHPEDAAKLLAVGELKPQAKEEPALVAAWTMLANELLNLDEALNK